MVLRLLFLVCLISAPLPSLSQGSGKAKPRVPVTKPTEGVSKAGIVYVVGDVHKPMGVSMKDNLGSLLFAQNADAPIYIPVAKTRIPAAPVTCERICGST
jgi:hypothetical protein